MKIKQKTKIAEFVVSESMREESMEHEAMICCDELVKIYQTDQVKVMALQGLDLEIKEGEMVAIIGKSGSGKSTLLNMIGGLETLSAGRLLINGKDLGSNAWKNKDFYRKNTIGFVWQKPSRNLFPYLTVLDNVKAPMLFAGKKKKESREKAMELLRQVGMDHYANKLPEHLSGGEQQRVAIATALANEPKILLADEPTGAVDTRTANQIFTLLQKLNREIGLTILIVTHDMSIADKVSRTVMISDGKISTEKIRRGQKEEQAEEYGNFTWEEKAEEYSVLDKARRVQLTEDILEAAGINSNKVKVEVIGGKVIITGEKQG